MSPVYVGFADGRPAEPRVGTVYLLHFSRPLHHARHYVGFTQNLEKRMRRHRSGEGSPLVRAAVAAGIEIYLARFWDTVTVGFERRLHSRSGSLSSICPICKGPSAKRRGNPRRDPYTGIGV